ncbi:23S rRNA (adenine(2503)-C(2))-methyltransferase RlmN [Clostridia bacterium]|nr:23S rRNA (adenine(2503)-C(2))-methyltransferase RlmN [Clostridia bacterium]
MDNNLYGYSIEELTSLMKRENLPRFRAKQIFNWIQINHASSFTEMTNIPKTIATRLEDAGYSCTLPTVLQKSISDDQMTIKCLLELEDGQQIETVLMRYHRSSARNRNTVCVSSQAGCAMGCPFCATGNAGFKRNLSTAEIVGQIALMNKLLQELEAEENVTNVVYMGMGEPLNNYEQVVRSIRLLNEDQGLNIGMRRITVSTCGLVPQILRLAEEGMQVTLAVSLHATTNAKRDILVPVNKKYPLEVLLKTCERYYETTKRKLTFEYTLIEGENDSEQDARNLKSLLRNLHCNINVIPLNVVSHADYKRSHFAQHFAKRLNDMNLEAFIREEMGLGIDAACGQLKGNGGK